MSSSFGPRKLRYTIQSVKDIFSNVSLTPDFKLTFSSLPQDLQNYVSGSGVLKNNPNFFDKLELMCFNTNLPGSQLEVFNSMGDYQGQIESFPSVRNYGRSIRLNFYVDKNHEIIRFFEEWMNFIFPLFDSNGVVDSTQDGQPLSAISRHNINRVRYPDEYRINFILTKFEKDVGVSVSDYLSYQFIGAYPINISPMQVSYGNSQVLKMSIDMSYQRYITRNHRSNLI